MAEASLTLVTAAPPRRRGPRPGGPYGHKPHTSTDTHHNRPQQHPQPNNSTHETPLGDGREHAHANAPHIRKPTNYILTPDTPCPTQEPQSEEEQESLDTDANYELRDRDGLAGVEREIPGGRWCSCRMWKEGLYNDVSGGHRRRWRLREIIARERLVGEVEWGQRRFGGRWGGGSSAWMAQERFSALVRHVNLLL